MSVLVLQKHDTNRSAAPLVAREFLQKRKLTGPQAARTDERKIGAGDGTRTRDIQLGRLELYQLSYSRSWWTDRLMVEGGGFEPPKAMPTDLQSAPFGRSGTPPSHYFYSTCPAS